MSEFMDFADRISQEQGMQPLMDVVNQLMEVPDEAINDETVEMISGMINGAFTPALREDAIAGLLKNFQIENYNRAKAAAIGQQVREGFNELLDSLQASDAKRRLFDSVFGVIYGIVDEAVARYHSFDIELPIKLDEGARLPTYAHTTDACADVYALETTVVKAHTLGNKIRTGLHFGLPENWQIGLLPRSSTGTKTPLRLSNSRGVLDEDYRGELLVLYDNISDSDYTINAGDRIAQMWVEPVYRFKAVETDALSETERGEGGFGSTGA